MRRAASRKPSKSKMVVNDEDSAYDRAREKVEAIKREREEACASRL